MTGAMVKTAVAYAGIKRANEARAISRFMGFMGCRFLEQNGLRDVTRRAKRPLYDKRKTAFTKSLLVKQCSISQVSK
jgi:hypothetical protein